jgi:hypothetical protein
MDLKKTVQIVEIVGGVGILISLIILIIEVRANTNAIDRQASLERNARVFEPYISNIPDIYTKVKAVDGLEPIVGKYADAYDIPPIEAVRWVAFLQSNWKAYEIDFKYAGQTQEMDASVLWMLSFPDNEMYWNAMKSDFSAEFVEYVEKLASQ